MTKKNICIDISNIVPGKGGSGGGISTYSLNLIKSLDKICGENELYIYCIKQSSFKGFENCSKIKFINININMQNFISRTFWIQIYLPFFCIRNKVNLLHRVTPELPVLKVCKYMCTLHDLMFDFYISHKKIRKFLSKVELIKFFIFRIISRHSILCSDSIIVPSRAIKTEVIKKYRTNSDKLHIIYEASENLNTFTYPQTSSESLNIGVIAGFYPHKGHLKVLELAHELIQQNFTEFKIFFRGKPAFPDYVKEINTVKEKLSLNEHIFFVPFQAKVTLHEIYSDFNLVLLLSEYEGFGLPVIEAQTHHLPVFCSDIEVFKELLGESAYFIKSSFDKVTIENLIKTFKNKSILNSYKQLGLSNLEKFSWEKMGLETYNLYNKTIKKKVKR